MEADKIWGIIAVLVVIGILTMLLIVGFMGEQLPAWKAMFENLLGGQRIV